MSKSFTAGLLIISMFCLMGCNSKKEKDTAETYDNLKSATLEPMELNIYTYGGTVTSNGKDNIEAMLAKIQPATYISHY